MDRNIGRFAVSSVYDSLTKPFEVDHFDASVCIEVVENLCNPRQLIRTVYQSLRAGSLLVITTPYWDSIRNIALAVANRTDLALTALWVGGLIKHFSRRTLIELVTEQVFEFIEFEGCGEGFTGPYPFFMEWNAIVF